MTLCHASKEIIEFPEVRKTKYTKDFSEQNFAQASRQAVIDMRDDLNRVR